ncbi:hypothetical protein [Sporolactobacillus putidus]|uniref:Uncharacterized protein n=1 Tax=Sporolactobacillus putidus TaxID=492735 RepID=A0A917S8L1_9BACL|nr:hypothetical protein [Sporolactobacillus putidus]GGL64606.1 hypothetical protein GCM10007968_30690 [Sporolactobacillus putidus]
MASLIEKIVETGNIKIHLIPTNKFKTITMALNFKSAFNDEKMITMRALLPYALMNFIPKNILEQRLD